MRNSEKVAIAAHLHVLLRRKTGRVTDTEWMATDTRYATEIVRFAREYIAKNNDADLADWTNKLEAAVLGTPMATPAEPAVSQSHQADTTSEDPAKARYVWGIR